MSSDSSLFIKRIRHLSLALIFSGALNISVLSLLLYWTLRERPPTPYCELKPSNTEQQISLLDQRGCVEVLNHFSQLSFSSLLTRLSSELLIENGYAERDLALAYLVAFHHFDIHRALPRNPKLLQKRMFSWKAKGQETTVPLIIYPDLSQEQFDAIIRFASTEHWPLTPEGLFFSLKEQKEQHYQDEHLVETFVLTPEFWTVDLLFNRTQQRVSRQELLSILLEGNWELLKQFVDQQRQSQDTSDARRQIFLLDYLKAGSSSAAGLLLKLEWDLVVKKLDDQQVITLLQLMLPGREESSRFAKEMLAGPRSTQVRQQASQWLYNQTGEPIPKVWNYEKALSHFFPEKPKAEKIDLIAKPLQAKPIPVTIPTPKGVVKPIFVEKKVGISDPVKKKRDELIAKPKEYHVQQGDTLWKIAKRFAIKVDDLKAYNKLKSDSLKKGMILKIPEK